jgi:hypothetical protein
VPATATATAAATSVGGGALAAISRNSSTRDSSGGDPAKAAAASAVTAGGTASSSSNNNNNNDNNDNDNDDNDNDDNDNDDNDNDDDDAHPIDALLRNAFADGVKEAILTVRRGSESLAAETVGGGDGGAGGASSAGPGARAPNGIVGMKDATMSPSGQVNPPSAASQVKSRPLSAPSASKANPNGAIKPAGAAAQTSTRGSVGVSDMVSAGEADGVEPRRSIVGSRAQSVPLAYSAPAPHDFTHVTTTEHIATVGKVMDAQGHSHCCLASLFRRAHCLVTPFPYFAFFTLHNVVTLFALVSLWVSSHSLL